MRTTILIFLVLMILVTCHKGEKNPLTATKIETENKRNEIEILIQQILDLPKLQWIYHPEVKDRLPVKVVASGLVTKELNLKKFDKNVLILTKDELRMKKIPDYVFIEELFFVGDTVSFYLTYDVEGAFADGKLIKVEGKWTPLHYAVGEY